MFLTEANVLHYLNGRRFGGPVSVVRGEYTVHNLSRRNSNFRVTCGAHEFLVKQAGRWDPAGRGSIEREAGLCRRAATDERFAALAPLIPAVYSYDPENSILVFEFLPDETALYDAPAEFAPRTARRAGEVMAAYHRSMQSPALAEMFPAELPAFFDMHQWSVEALPARAAAQRELVRLVQRHAGFAPALEAASSVWRRSTLIHGDWKLENVLISSDGARLHVIDWELAGWGDPRWDVATLLQSWWNRWVRAPEQYSLDAIRPTLRAFLSACGAEPMEILPFAAVRMLQSAWEALQHEAHMQGDAVRLAQVSLNILTQPDWAREELLGHE
jgi:aminoglycoside phosphotransferase (APT) family kinase protein